MVVVMVLVVMVARPTTTNDTKRKKKKKEEKGRKDISVAAAEERKKKKRPSYRFPNRAQGSVFTLNAEGVAACGGDNEAECVPSPLARCRSRRWVSSSESYRRWRRLREGYPFFFSSKSL